MSKRSTPSRGGTSFNRRDFLKGSGATVAASAMAAGGVP
ncbi:MAG: hypothetical protein DWQ29_17750, partial [Planctomycetota bacterium]